jgi:hypothetical protein
MSEAAQPRRAGSEIVRLLESALAPVEPPAQLADQLETRLAEVQAIGCGQPQRWRSERRPAPRWWC